MSWNIKKILSVLLVTVGVVPAFALMPSSYDMENGNGTASGGSFNYWDLNYTGSGSTTTDRAMLTGGLGDLTDGIVTDQNWFAIENNDGTGPYVGWRFSDPSILFHFDSTVNVTSMSFHFDDSNGAGGVSAPTGVTIEGNFYAIGDQPGSDPFWFTVSGLNLQSDQVNVTLNRGNEWVFLDEVQFNAVPEPCSMVALGAGAAAMALRKRRAR